MGDAPQAAWKTGEMLRDASSRTLIDNIAGFGMSQCNARAALFFWLDEALELLGIQSYNVPSGAMDAYQTMLDQDPIHIGKLIRAEAGIAILYDHAAQTSDFVGSRYHDYLQSINFGDEINLVFWHGGHPLACLALCRSLEDPPFSRDTMDWDGLRDHFATSLNSHWRMRSVVQRTSLVSRYALRPRELEVVDLIALGCDNSAIAQLMGINLSTVKSHVVNVLDKMGADSRLAVAAIAHQLQFQ